jgi:hypothetical protein
MPPKKPKPTSSRTTSRSRTTRRTTSASSGKAGAASTGKAGASSASKSPASPMHPMYGLKGAGAAGAVETVDFKGIPRRSAGLDPAAEGSLGKVTSTFSGKAGDAEKKISEKGYSATVEKVTARLTRSSLDDATRLVVSEPDVYGALLLEAIETDKVKPDDATGLYNAVVRRAEKPRRALEKELVDHVLARNKIVPGRALKARVLARVREDGVPLTGRSAEDTVLSFYRSAVAEGELPEAVEAFAAKNEIPKSKLTPAVKESMVQYLQGLDLDIPADRVRRSGKYDEYFAVAYDRASAVGDGRSDPIVLSRPQGFVSPWDFQVDTFETADQQAVDKTNIMAAGALDYVYNLGELLGVFKLADALVLNWAAGALDISDTQTSNQLYRYWKVRDDRMSPEERGMLYKRVLDKGDTDVLSKMVVNSQFPTLWDNLMQEVATYVQANADAAVDKNVSQIAIHRAIQELQYNLTEFMTGMAHMQVTEMYAQLKDAMTLLGSDNVVSQLSGGRRKNVWSVIAYLSKQELGTAPDVAAIRTLAVDGNRVFQRIAQFTVGGFSDADFQDFLDAAEAWILAAASLGDYQPPSGDTYGDQDYQDEFSDDFETVGVGSDWDS